MNQLKKVLNSPEPHLAVVITDLASERRTEFPDGAVDVVELRIDKFSNITPDAIRETCQAYRHIPLLATIRQSLEGGGWEGTNTERRKLFKAILPYVDAIDIELASGDVKTVQLAKDAGKVVIASSHDFEKTPSERELALRRRKALYELGADYFKIAATADSEAELGRLVKLVTRFKQDKNTIAVAMGSYGPLSRVVLPALGSRLTYASVSKVAVAPGQMDYLETRGLLDKLYPAS